MRPWLHIPIAILLTSLLVAGWVWLREVPMEDLGGQVVMAAPLDHLPPTLPSGVLTGQLLDETGQPVADADLSTLQDGRVLWCKTDNQGWFELRGLQPGPLELSVLPFDRRPETFAVEGPGENVFLNLRRPHDNPPPIPELARSDWQGRIRNPLWPGRLQGYEVWLVPAGPADALTSGVPRRARTDTRGGFEFRGLLHAPYRLHILPRDLAGALEPNLLVPFGQDAPLVVFGSSATQAEWNLQAGELFGTLEQDGEPIRAALIMPEILGSSDAESGPLRVLPPVQTDRAGNWTLTDLPPATYRIQVRGGGIGKEQLIELGPNQRLRVRF
ncbi:MAG: carboxypeptidase-like regulatory domain-containing protein [Planctomycetota bacterium]